MKSHRNVEPRIHGRIIHGLYLHIRILQILQDTLIDHLYIQLAHMLLMLMLIRHILMHIMIHLRLLHRFYDFRWCWGLSAIQTFGANIIVEPWVVGGFVLGQDLSERRRR